MRTDADANANTDEDFSTPNGKHKNAASPEQPTTTGNQHRRGRSLSWPGEAIVAPPPPPSRDCAYVALQEAITLTVFTLLFTAMRYVLDSVVELSSQHQADAEQRQDETDQAGELFMTAKVLQSLVAGWFLKLLPSKVQTRQAPGFVLAPVWWSLLWMRGGTTMVATTPNLPHLPFRICEMMMGRIQKREVLLIAVVHCVLTPLIMFALSTALPDIIVERSVSPIIYKESGNPWLILSDLLSELLVNTAFPVALFVLPVILTLNHLPPWLTLVVIYPLYNWRVDANGQASTFSPIILLSQDILNARPSLALARAVTQLVGVFAAGNILQVYFPDDPKV
jgi:hypothetical protein